MHWSSERPAPKITIDYGDGRVLQTTVTGNSCHFVLNHHGEVCGVMPGLMDAETFTAMCEVAIRAHTKTSPIDDKSRRQSALHYNLALLMKEHSQAVVDSIQGSMQVQPLPTKTKLEELQLERQSGISTAVRRALFDQLIATPRNSALEAINISTSKMGGQMAIVREVSPKNGTVEALFEDPSRYSKLPAWVAEEIEASVESEDEKVRKLAQFCRTLKIDSFRGATEHVFMCLKAMEGRDLSDFDGIVATIYAEVFLTPREDEWLGLRDPLAWDGIIR